MGGELSKNNAKMGVLSIMPNVKFIFKKCHHILVMLTDFPSKIIDLCHKISVILVYITRPNSTKYVTCP